MCNVFRCPVGKSESGELACVAHKSVPKIRRHTPEYTRIADVSHEKKKHTPPITYTLHNTYTQHICVCIRLYFNHSAILRWTNIDVNR